MSHFRHVRRIRLSRILIPNTVTAIAIFAGYIAILMAFQGQFIASAAAILLACMLDMLDGRLARMFKATSEFGVQFDSLADMANYGMAPALIFYFLYFKDWGLLGIALSFLPICCAAIRLARFNEDADPQVPITHFVGLPTTIAALVLAGFVIFAHDNHIPTEIAQRQAALLIGITAMLMISQVQYEKSNILSLRYIRKTRRVITGTIILLSLIFFPTVAFFAWGLLYILYGLARSGIHTILEGREDTDPEE
jgi:CDP-diacylglycerol--serine O-phosphatidyltransferase